ncbi:hypothetical protein ACO0LO_23260 [Undibacterium sp. TJN25]|uniref:hypothetical protein n=1 Tax=Undibacterium sp. TJN25 TaxID=3413056 RepID=UPI003BF2D864
MQVKDKLRFLRHLRPYWEVYRHRLAPEPHKNFQRAFEEGKVEIIAGRIIDFMQIDTENIKAIIRFRHSSENVQLRIGQVINCTGPSSNLTQIDDELIKNLLQKNIILPDPLGLGLQVSDQLAVMDRFGNPSNNIFYIGPLLRAKYWEATAVPELRVFARQLAIHILNLGLGSATKT